MKQSFFRFAALFLCLAVLFPLVSCSTLEAPSSETEEIKKNAGQKDKKTAEVYDPVTWEKINAIPVASPDMTTDQLRQICVDYFRLQLSFQWTPAESFSYVIASKGTTVRINKGTVYGGNLYVTHAFSNLYRVMNYYDEKTGVISIPTKNGDSIAEILGNQCSYGSYWGWARVSNSITHSLTHTITPASGIVPIGPYKSTDQKTYSNTDAICEENGEQIMYQSYAEFLPADGMVTYNTAGHVRMVSEKAHVVYKEDGTIDGNESYVLYLDQGSSWSSRKTENGGNYQVQGGIDRKTSFQQMYHSGYLPFTIKEFVGLDPVEKGEITVTNGEITDRMSLKELSELELESNYTVSDITVHFEDTSGKVLYDNIASTGSLYCYQVSLRNGMFLSSIKSAVKNSDGVLTVSCRLGTGESITVYQGPIKES